MYILYLCIIVYNYTVLVNIYSRAPYSTEQIVAIYDYLHRLGGPNGMIRQSEFFLYSQKDRVLSFKKM